MNNLLKNTTRFSCFALALVLIFSYAHLGYGQIKDEPSGPLTLYLPITFATTSIANYGFETPESGDPFGSWTPGGAMDKSIVTELDFDGLAGDEEVEVSAELSGKYATLLGNPTYPNDGGVPVNQFSRLSLSNIALPENAATLAFDYIIISHDIGWNNTDIFDTFEVYIGDYTNVTDTHQNNVCRNKIQPSDSLEGLLYCDGWTGQATQLDPPNRTETKTGRIDLTLTPEEISEINILSFLVHNRGDGFYNTWVYLDDVRFLDENDEPLR